MNFCYIFTIFYAICILALIFVNSIEAFVARRHNGNTTQQLNVFRQEAYKTKEDLERLAITARENQELGKRRRRQTTGNILNNFSQNMDIGQLVLEPLDSNGVGENAGGVWSPDRLKHSLQPSKELEAFLSNLKQQQTKMPREISLFESDQMAGDGNELDDESSENEENNQMLESNDSQAKKNDEKRERANKGKRLKFKGFSMNQNDEDSGLRSKDNSFKNSKDHVKNTEMLQSFLRDNNEITTNQLSSCSNSDLSSCQHCSEHEQIRNLNNHDRENKYTLANKERLTQGRHNINSKFLSTPSKQFKKLDQSFAQKYPSENLEDEEDEEEEEDDLYQLKSPSVITNANKLEIEHLNTSLSSNFKHSNNVDNNSASFETSKNSHQPLNDQLENTKNNLSHEANYKLSKVEQDAAEKRKDFTWKWGIFKRSYAFNPLNEIKLKTSSRLMKKGFGASLPSYSLGETRKELMIENMLRKKELEMLQQKSGKYDGRNSEVCNRPFDRKCSKQMGDFEDLSVEGELKELPQINWNYNREKRISDSCSRYKREEEVRNHKIKSDNKAEGLAIKSFKSQEVKVSRADNNDLRNEHAGELKLNKTNMTEKAIHSLVSKPNYETEVFIKPLTSDENLAIQSEREETKLPAIGHQGKSSKNTENSENALRTRNAVVKHSNQDQSHFHLNQAVNFQDFPVDFLAERDYGANLRSLRRRKRSLVREKFIKYPVGNKTSQFPENLDNISHNFDSPKISIQIPRNKTTKALDELKLLNPSKTLQLNINQNLHSLRALRLENLKGLTTKQLMKLIKRFKRANLLYAKNSASKHNLITTKLMKMFLKKAGNFKRQFKAFLTQTLTYLIPQNLSNKYLNTSHPSRNDDFKSLSLQSKQLKALNTTESYVKAFELNVTNQLSNEKIMKENFKFDATKRTYKIMMKSKLKALRVKLHNLFSYKSLNDKSTSERSEQFLDLSERSSSIKGLQKSKNFSKSSHESLLKDSNVQMCQTKAVLNSNEFESGKYFYNISKDNLNGTELLTNSELKPADSINMYKGREKGFLYIKLKDRNIVKSSHDSLVSKEQQKEALKSDYNDLKVADTTSFKNVTGKSFFNNSYNETKKQAFVSEYFTNLHRGKLNKLGNRPLRRFKRSLNSKSAINRVKSTGTKSFNKKRYLSQFDNLYKPENKMDFWSTKLAKSNVENEFNKPNDFDFERIHKSFNQQEFDNFKEKDNTQQKFEDIKFDNIWFENKSNSKYGRRFVKPKHSRTFSKRHNFPNIKAVNESHERALKSMDFPVKVKMLKDKYLSDLQHFNENYKFNENHFNWPTPKLKNYIDNNSSNTDNLATTDDSQKLNLELRNEILNCKAFSSLEEFLKSLPKNITDSLINGHTEKASKDQNTETIEMDIKTEIITEVTTTSAPTVLDSTIVCSSTTEDNFIEETETSTECSEDDTPDAEEYPEQTTESSSEEFTEVTPTDAVLETGSTECFPSNSLSEGEEDVKLNITINANVHGNPKTHHFCGNGSFNFIPGLEDDRRRREIFFSPLENFQKRKCAQIATQKPYDNEDNEDFSDLISGKLSSNVVKTILNTVQESPSLKQLWPSLKNNQPGENTAAANFFSIRNQQTENQLQNSERLLAQVMASINQIIEQQARSHACVPLRPDLQEFYNMILLSRREQDRVREKRQLMKTTQKADFSYTVPLLDPKRIQEETTIVKNLLKQYEELAQEDQQQVAAVRDDLLKNLLILRQLQNDEEQQKMELRERREHAWDVSDEEVMKDLQSQYSVQFLKLLKAAELYREISSK